MAIQSLNPATNTVEKSFTAHTLKEVQEMIVEADAAQQDWRQKTFQERAAKMNTCADLLDKNAEKYGRIITLEMGKPLSEAISEVQKCAKACRYYAENAEAFLADTQIETAAEKSFIAFEPLGVILAIMPWNFPFWQVFRFAAPALMAGNAGILKHASNVPQSALAIEEVIHEAGFPKEIFRSALIESSEVEHIIANPLIKAVTLTGSEGAGAKVAAEAGKHIKKTVLELGGSDAFIVLADADLEKAAETAVKSRMINTGQSCIAAKRFIVEESVSEAFIEKMTQKMQKLKTGNPLEEEIDYGPLARKDLADELEKQVKESVEMGAEIVLDGGRSDKESAYFKPMILKKLEPGMPAYEQELFGPVATVFVVKDTEEAIKIANDSKFGLGGSVWTKNKEKGLEVARKIETGAMFINALVHSDPAMPFGGVKKSGYGRELSYLGIREFVNQKSIWVN